MGIQILVADDHPLMMSHDHVMMSLWMALRRDQAFLGSER
jgi:hypothetical protein